MLIKETCSNYSRIKEMRISSASNQESIQLANSHQSKEIIEREREREREEETWGGIPDRANLFWVPFSVFGKFLKKRILLLVFVIRMHLWGEYDNL